MSQASLNRVWVVLFGTLFYLGLMGLGLYQLVQQSPRLTFRPPAQEAQSGLRGRLLAGSMRWQRASMISMAGIT